MENSFAAKHTSETASTLPAMMMVRDRSFIGNLDYRMLEAPVSGACAASFTKAVIHYVAAAIPLGFSGRV
jgi:hypothetical protein